MKNFPKAIFNISNNDLLYLPMNMYGSESFIDKSFHNHSISNLNNILQVSDYGGLFNSNLKYLDIPVPNNIYVEDREFTIELMCYFNTINNVCLLDIGSISSSKFSLRINESGSSNVCCMLGYNSYIISSNIIIEKWYNICWTRQYDTLFGFINGTKFLETNISNKSIGFGPVRIGFPLTGSIVGSNNFYLKNVRISNDCRYVDSYIPCNMTLPELTIVNINSGKSTNINNTDVSSNTNIKLSDTTKTINLKSLQNDDQSILNIINLSSNTFYNDFTIEGYFFIPDITKQYLLVSPFGILNSWGIQILNEKLVWNNLFSTKYFTSLYIRQGWNHIAICKKDSTISIYLNTIRDQQLVDSNEYPIIGDSISIGRVVEYSRYITSKSLAKSSNSSTIHTFNIPENWLNSVIYFKIGYLNEMESIGDVILNINIYKTDIGNKFINFDNLILSQTNFIFIDGTRKFKEIILNSSISEFETDSMNYFYTIIITRLPNLELDTFPDDFKIVSIKAVLMSDTKYKLQDPDISYLDLEIINNSQDYNVPLTDSDKIINTGFSKPINYYLPIPTEEYLQLNFNTTVGKKIYIYSPLGIFENMISKVNLIQFLSYDDEWNIISNNNFSKFFNYFEVIKSWYSEYFKFQLESIASKNSLISNLIEDIVESDISTFKYIGGVLGPDSNIYCIPYNSISILKIVPGDNTTISRSGNFSEPSKWAGGVLSPDGDIYGIPYDSGSILKFTPGNIISPSFHGTFPENSKFFGGVLGPDGNIYCIPYNSTSILKIVPGTNPEISTFGSFSGVSKWAGGVLGPDGNIYCIPHTSADILKIIPGTDPQVEIINTLDSAIDKYSSAILSTDNSIYCVPYSSQKILKIKFNSFRSFTNDILLSGYLNKF